MVGTNLSLDEIMEALYESFEQHKTWYENYEDLVKSYVSELKRVCDIYIKEYDEKTLHYKLANFLSTRNHYTA